MSADRTRKENERVKGRAKFSSQDSGGREQKCGGRKEILSKSEQTEKSNQNMGAGKTPSPVNLPDSGNRGTEEGIEFLENGLLGYNFKR